MDFKYNVTGAERKRLAEAISEIHGGTPHYLGAPTFAYEVDYFTINRDGTVSFDDSADSKEIEMLVEKLVERGFHPLPDMTAQKAADAPITEPLRGETSEGGDAPESPQEAAVAETCGFCVELPREGVTDEAVENLKKLVNSKAALIRRALGAERLDITVTDERISFPWFDTPPEPDMASAADRFIGRLLDTARTQKRVTAREKPVENEKFAFRCFLLRLGYIGEESKADRKILLHNLTGSAAFRDGSGAKANGS